MIFWTLILLLAIVAAGVVATFLGGLIASVAAVLIGLWIFFALFTLYFFRDPTPVVPSVANAIVAPAQGKVDLIDEALVSEYMGITCLSFSIFLSFFDFHVKRDPFSGVVAFLKHREGKFLSSSASDCGARSNEYTPAFLPFSSLEMT